MTPAEIAALAARLSAAAAAYHNGAAELLMTDDEYDAALERLRVAAPAHPFLKQVGAPVTTGDEVALPIPLPSLNKIKPDDGSLEKWLARNPVPATATYHISLKLDGCSALWIPATRRLYTRGDGMHGRDLSAFAPFFQGFPAAAAPASIGAVRGELIMRTDSPAIPADRLARNIVAGALNRKEPDPALFAEIRFVAYELLEPATLTPTEAFRQLRLAGYEVVRSSALTADRMTPTELSELFSLVESKSPYQIDGIVVAPNVARPAAPVAVRKGEALNPVDRVAWKTRSAGAATTAITTVRTVEWNPSASGYLIPRVLFDTVALAGANIGASTGLHGRWITDNAVGPGAIVEVRRAGDVIPQIVAVRSAAPGGPAMPPPGSWEWVGADPTTAVHIRVASTTGDTAETACVRLTRALGELGAENVGPGLVAKLYAAGYRTVGAIYTASADEFAAKVEGVKARGAARLWEGLRAGRAGWTELTLLVASCCMPRGIGHTRLAPLLAINPTPATWTVAGLTAGGGSPPAGLTIKTVESIVAAVPAYVAWRAENFGATVFTTPAAPAPAAAGPKATVVLTGFRDRVLEAALEAAGHTIADAVSRKTTHLVYPDGPEPTSTKITKARELGTAIQILPVSAFRTALGL
jgi:DNA ligase (NAD+)